jgi:uncharacterized protein
MEKKLQFLKEAVEERLSGELFANMDHALRVTGLALKLGEELECDREILVAAGLLHDIGVPLDKKQHYVAGVIPAKELLKKVGFPTAKIAGVLHAIEAHSRYGGPDPQTNEAKALYDADCIDFIGAIGLARGFYRNFASGKKLDGSVVEIQSMVRKLIDTISAEAMFTDMGRTIRQQRLAYLSGYLKTFVAENGVSFNL